MIEAVIFDMDGVLVDSYAAHLESWRGLAREVGLEITEAQFAATFGRTSREIIRQLFGASDDARVRALDDRKEAIYRDIIREAVPEMTGAREAVKRLADLGLRLAAGSSGPPENVALVCDALGFGRFFTATVTGTDVSRGKPDPQVFLLAAQRLGVAPESCVVVEDAPSGIEAARRAGMRSVGLTGTHAAVALEAADAVVSSLGEACDVIDMWRTKGVGIPPAGEHEKH